MTNQTTGRAGLPCLINSHKKQFLKVIRYELISAPAYPGKTKGYFNGNSRLLRLKQKGISKRRNASGKTNVRTDGFPSMAPTEKVTTVKISINC